MSIKLTFVFGLLLASGWTQEQVLESEINQEPEKVLELVKEAFVKAKAGVNLGNKKIQDKLNKEVDENVEKTDNGVEASANASASFNFNFEELIVKLFEAVQQNKENDKDENNDEEINKKEEDNKEAEDNVQSEENTAEKMKSPFINSYNVHARASASASSSSSSSSSFYFNFYDPKEGDEGENAEIQDKNTEAPQENDNIVEDSQENFEENEQPIDVENDEVPEHCNQQNSIDKELVIEEPLKPEGETQVEEVEQ